MGTTHNPLKGLKKTFLLFGPQLAYISNFTNKAEAYLINIYENILNWGGNNIKIISLKKRTSFLLLFKIGFHVHFIKQKYKRRIRLFPLYFVFSRSLFVRTGMRQRRRGSRGPRWRGWRGRLTNRSAQSIQTTFFCAILISTYNFYFKISVFFKE